MRMGLVINAGDGASLDDVVDLFVNAERSGFASAWLPSIFGLDALMVLALAGGKTARIELGTAVVPTYPRHPYAMAQMAATANVAAGGRLALGLGRSHQIVIETMFGIAYDKPITHMREYVSIVRALTAEGQCSFEGKMYRVNATLGIKDAAPMPILIGALMPKMLEVCGQLCDGTLTWMAGPRHIEKNVVPVLAKTSSAAGRPMPRVVCSLPVCVTDNRDDAHATAARLFEHYGFLPVYRSCLDEEGVAGPADVAIIGNEKEVRAGLERVRDAGASDFYAGIFPCDADGRSSTQRTLALLESFRGQL